MQQTPRIIVVIIVSALVAVVILGMIGAYLLITQKADPSHIALFAGIPSTALGGLMAILSNTRSVPEPASTTQTTVTRTEPTKPDENENQDH